tara:strand:- start:350 stop:553 length:204 start_codon:yes stop_codon:yes gene_type:complete
MNISYDSFVGQYYNFIKGPILRTGRHKYGFILKNGTKIFFKDSMLSDSNRAKMGNIIKEWSGQEGVK